MKYDFIAIGDTVMDVFIRLQEAEITKNENGSEVLSVAFGAKIPFESATELPAVGNSANASVSAARLGLQTALVTNLGADAHGEQSKKELEKNNVSTSLVTLHEGKKTNYHYVLWFNDDRTILINHEHYDYTLPAFKAPAWIYLSSLGDNTLEYHDEIADYVEQNPQVKLAFQPGTFQLKAGIERLKRLYARTEVFVCNVEEARFLLGEQQASVQDLLRKVQAYGPKIVLITDGKRGAYLLHDNKTYFMPPYPDAQPPYERTGAGDAFASTFVAFLALGKNPLEALRYAPINSMSVVQHIGAQAGLLTRDAIETLLSNAPASYTPQEII